MNRQGKYDSIVDQALREGVPVARVMRKAGFSEVNIRSCQGMLRRIRARIAPEDDLLWYERAHRCYINRRREALERLESGKSRSESGDLQLIEAYSRALKQMSKHKNGSECDPPENDYIDPGAL